MTHVVVQDGGFTIEFEDGFVKQSWHQVVATLELTDADCTEVVGVDQQEQVTRAAREQEKQEQGLATGTASCTATSQQQNLRNAPAKSGPAVRSEERASRGYKRLDSLKRPPGRARKGKVWDSDVGAWVDNIESTNVDQPETSNDNKSKASTPPPTIHNKDTTPSSRAIPGYGATLEPTDVDCTELAEVGADQQEQLTRAAHEQEMQEQGLATSQQNLRNAPTKSGLAVRSEECAPPPAQSMSERAPPPARCSKRTAAVVAQCRMETNNADEYDFKTEVSRANQSLLSQAVVAPDWIDCGLNLKPQSYLLLLLLL